ncbi:MAG: hypothetical protein IT379_06860 [Deltaproteobacteria bacterium]|nr:hypothetical protein [Deltaproteobacteria bacterium]
MSVSRSMILAWAMWLGASCGDAGAEDGLTAAPDGGARMDAAPPGPPQPPAADAGIEPPDVGPSRPDGSSPPPGPGALDGLNVEWAECGDRDAEASDGLTDCASSSCVTAPICCADNEACCVDGTAMLSVRFAECASAADDACLADLEVLGPARPAVVSDGSGGALWLAPAGPGSVGVASRTRFDPSSALEAAVTLATLQGCSPGACQEMVGVGLATDTVSSPGVSELAAVLSAATGQLLLLSRGEVIRRAPIDLSSPTTGRLSVAIDAAGAATATFASDRGVTTSVHAGEAPRVTTRLRVVAFGRGENAREATIVVREVSASTRVCDRPSAWTLEPVVVTNGRGLPGTWTALAVADGPGPSGTTRRFALQSDGRLYTGALAADASVTFDATVEGALLGSYADGVPAVESLGALVYAPMRGQWELYVARNGLDVARIPSSTGATFDRASATKVIAAADVGVASVDQPAISIDFRGYTTLAFRARGEDGATWIGSVSDRGDGAFVLDEDFLAPSERSDAFDRDGVESPALVSYGELLHLYYVGRRGVGRSMGLARRTAAGGWERFDDGAAVLVPGIEPWRTFGVGAPAVAVAASGATTAVLDVYYLATGAEGVSLQRASREVPWIGR